MVCIDLHDFISGACASLDFCMPGGGPGTNPSTFT